MFQEEEKKNFYDMISTTWLSIEIFPQISYFPWFCETGLILLNGHVAEYFQICVRITTSFDNASYNLHVNPYQKYCLSQKTFHMRKK